MPERPVGRHAIRTRQHRRREIGDRGRVGAHIAALVVKEFDIDAQNAARAVDRGSHLVPLLARMVGRDQVLAPVLDPFHRPAEPQRCETDQHVLGIELAANAEAAADMTFEQVNGRGIAPKHAGDVVSIPVRHLGGAVHLHDVVRGIVARNRAARFQRNAGMAPDRQIQLHHGVSAAKRGRDIAVRLFHERCLGRTAVLELAGRRAGVEDDRQFVDRDRDEIGSVLRHIGIGREHRRNRIADIAHPPRGQDRLTVGCQSFDAGQPEIDRRDVGNVGECPDRHDARQGPGHAGVDRPDVAVRVGRPHHPHMQHMRKNDIGGEPAAPGHQRPVLEARNRASDEAHVMPAAGAKRRAAPRGCAAGSPGTRRSIRRTATVRR